MLILDESDEWLNKAFKKQTCDVLLQTNDHLEFLTAALKADTKKGLLWTVTIVFWSYYSHSACWLVFLHFLNPVL